MKLKNSDLTTSKQCYNSQYNNNSNKKCIQMTECDFKYLIIKINLKRKKNSFFKEKEKKRQQTNSDSGAIKLCV